jgi:hypothetical protein
MLESHIDQTKSSYKSLTLYTREHFSCEFTLFLYNTRSLGILEQGSISGLCKYEIFAELQASHDRVASVFVDQMVP